MSEPGSQPVSAPPPPGGEPRGPGPGECRLCGSAPAADVTFRQHVGMVLLMQARSRPGPYCRGCGIATFRDLQNRTLLTGWWGVISLLVFSWSTPLYNLLSLRAVRRLGPPVRDPAVVSPLVAPLPPGLPLWRRPGPLVPLLLGAVALLLVVRAVTAPRSIDPRSDSVVGQCVVLVGGELRPIDCSGPHDGRVVQRLSPATLVDPCAVGGPVRYFSENVVLCVESSR